MKTINARLCLIITAVASLIALPSETLSQRREAAPVTFTKLAEQIYMIGGGSGANGGAYIGDNGVLLIDTKMDEASMKQVFDGLSKITDKKVVFLVNTHSDGDHVRGNRYMPGGVTIVAHENCRKEFYLPQRDGSASEWSDPALAAYVPSVTFSERMTLHVGDDRVELWHFGTAHTIGDAVIYFPGEKIAFIGDQYFEGRPALIHAYKGGSALGHIQNLERMLDLLDAVVFVSGHSNPVGRDDIQRHIGDMKKLVQAIESRIIQGDSLEAVRKRFAENESDLVGIIFNEIKARM